MGRPKKTPEEKRAAKKAHYEANKTRILAQQKEYYEANKDLISIRDKKYRDNNAEAVKRRRDRDSEKRAKQAKEWRERNKEYVQRYMQTYRGKNKEKISESKKITYRKKLEENRERSKKWRTANRERMRLQCRDRYYSNISEVRKYQKTRRLQLPDSVVASAIGAKTKEIPKEIIELKRQQLILLRATKQLNQAIKEQENAE